MEAASNKSYGGLIKSAISVSIGLAVVLTVSKCAVWFFSGSETMLASMLDSVMDGLGAVITFFVVRVSLVPPDAEHNFGHGKAEAIAGLFQSIIVIVTVGLVIWHSIIKLIEPEPLAHTGMALVVTGISMLLEWGVISYQHRIIDITQSAAVKADNIHLKADLFFNLGVVLSLVTVSLTGYQAFDSIFAIILGLVILYGAFSIGRTAMNMLLDHELPEQIVNDILGMTKRFPDIRSVHGLRTRQSGHVYFLQMHIVMSESISLAESHRVTEELEKCIHGKYSNVDVIIHVEPEDNECEEQEKEKRLYNS